MIELRQTWRCPHCDEPLVAFALPENSGWEGPVHWACFNDDCGYYRRGWDWMFERFGVKASYRHRVDPTTGKEFPLAVWSPTALRDRIVGDGMEGSLDKTEQTPAGAVR